METNQWNKVKKQRGMNRRSIEAIGLLILFLLVNYINYYFYGDINRFILITITISIFILIIYGVSYYDNMIVIGFVGRFSSDMNILLRFIKGGFNPPQYSISVFHDFLQTLGDKKHIGIIISSNKTVELLLIKQSHGCIISIQSTDVEPHDILNNVKEIVNDALVITSN